MGNKKKNSKKGSKKKLSHKEMYGDVDDKSDMLDKKANKRYIEEISIILEKNENSSKKEKGNKKIKKEEENSDIEELIESSNELENRIDNFEEPDYSEFINNSEAIYKNFILNENNIIIKKIDLENKIYEALFFIQKIVEGDGNCFYRCISYHIFGNDSFYNIIRETVYQYIKENTTFAYEYCHLKGDTYYFEVKEGKKTREYKITDYIELIKNDKFFAGYIEIYCVCRIYKIPIIILEPLEYNNENYYKLNSTFSDINENKDIFNIEEVIFLLYKNKLHYDYLNVNKGVIIQKIKSLSNSMNNEENYEINKITNIKKDLKVKIENKEKSKNNKKCYIQNNTLNENKKIE